MGQVTLTIAGRNHVIACRDGEELHLERLGALLERHTDTAIRASGGMSSERTLLFLALILADQVDEAERNPPGACRRCCSTIWRTGWKRSQPLLRIRSRSPKLTVAGTARCEL
ncbi:MULTISPECIES: cell division protein ZapA [unclassified Sphingomonas]|uniref:cell division protein ZapA n=1 Tax=unclassified Sphingomonas TaxID=196159 RepID=UPI0027E2C898|nr:MULTISPECIES: cell division protein ZapA [unclassified Sphingomonas]